nr:class I SAM-dependent methyltransferase [Falsiroseomonas frigidaquae]
MRPMIPEMANLRVLDLGCGYGWFARWAIGQGAQSVLGIDISERMLARARELTSGEDIEYRQGDLDALDLPVAGFDLVFSSLAFHYVEDLPGMLRQVHAAMAPGGMLVFSQEHPLRTAPSRQGWETLADGRRIWPLDRYLLDGPRNTEWLEASVVKQHRCMATLLNALIGAGFTLAGLQEWGASDEQIAAQPNLAKERDRPTFLLVKARN